MKRGLSIVLALGVLSTVTTHAQDAKTALDAAATALGVTSLKSIQLSGWGSDYIFGQPYDGHSPWPRFNLPSYSMTIDYTIPAMRDDRRRAQAENPPLGGGFQPLLGEIRQIWLMNGRYAWDVVGDTTVPAASERDMRSAVDGRMTQIWLTPHGFIKAAMANNASARTEEIRGAKKTVISFTTPTKVKLEGTLNDRHLVERIETWIDNPVLGDMLYEAAFNDYRDFGTVKFPTKILQRSGGYPILDVTITDVKPNVTATYEVPANIREAKPPAAEAVEAVEAQKVSDGVWILPGDAKSIAVEFRDHIVVVDAPQHEARSMAVMSAIKKAVPNKPVRYVVNTHIHFDHSGGLRTYAAEGATIITERSNIPFYEQAWANARTINPDRLAKSGRKAVFEGVTGSRMLTDGARKLFIYHYAGNMHNAGMLMVFLPKEKILIEADSFTPPANPSVPPTAMANLVHWYDAVQRLRLDVDQIIPIHGRLATLDDARKVIDSYRGVELFTR